jgi:hypothetical protein
MFCPKCGKPLTEKHDQCMFHWLYRTISIPQAITAVVLILVVIGLMRIYSPDDTIRAAISRVKIDQRIMSDALESYFLEHHCYPTWNTEPGQNAFKEEVLKYPLLANQPTFSLALGASAITLTTPNAYLISYPEDPYSPFKGITFCYWSKCLPKTEAGKSDWILWSPGPDKKYDLTLGNIAQAYDPDNPVPSPLLTELTYDPSNGTKGGGDIWRSNK